MPRSADAWRQRLLADRVEALLRESWPRRWAPAELAAAAGCTVDGLVVAVCSLRGEGVRIRTERVYSLPPED